MITLNLHNICQVPALLFKIISQAQDWRHIRAARTKKIVCRKDLMRMHQITTIYQKVDFDNVRNNTIS